MPYTGSLIILKYWKCGGMTVLYSSPLPSCWSRGSWRPHRSQTCIDLAWSSQWRLEPSLEPKHENPLLEQSNEIHETCYDTSEAQPRERERERDRQTDRQTERDRERDREREREKEREREMYTLYAITNLHDAQYHFTMKGWKHVNIQLRLRDQC